MCAPNGCQCWRGAGVLGSECLSGHIVVSCVRLSGWGFIVSGLLLDLVEGVCTCCLCGLGRVVVGFCPIFS